MWSQRWRQEGAEPDYRFSLANERTFLSWIRTALALLAGAVVVEQFASGPRATVVAIAMALSAWSAILAAMAYRRWRSNEIAMRHSQPLSSDAFVLFTAVVAVLICMLVAVLLTLK